MSSNHKNTAIIAVVFGALSIVAIASIAAILVRSSKRRKEKENEDDDGTSIDSDDENGETIIDDDGGSEIEPGVANVYIKVDNGLFLSMTGMEVTCNAATTGSSEAMSLIPSIHVEGAYYIKNLQGAYLTANEDESVSATYFEGRNQSWFIEKTLADGHAKIQAADGGYLARSGSLSMRTTAGQSYVTITDESFTEEELEKSVINDGTEQLCTVRAIQASGNNYMSASGAEGINFNGTSAGVNEKFKFVTLARYPGLVFIKTPHGQYISANSGGDLMLTDVPDHEAMWRGIIQTMSYLSSVDTGYYLARDSMDGSARTVKSTDISQTPAEYQTLFFINRTKS